MRMILFIWCLSCFPLCVWSQNEVAFDTQYELGFEKGSNSFRGSGYKKLMELVALYQSDSMNSLISMRPLIATPSSDSIADAKLSELNMNRLLHALSILRASNIPREKIVIGSCGMGGVEDHLILSVNNSYRLKLATFPFAKPMLDTIFFKHRLVECELHELSKLEVFSQYLKRNGSAKIVIDDPSGMYCFDTTGIKMRQWDRRELLIKHLQNNHISKERILLYSSGGSNLFKGATDALLIRLAYPDEMGPTQTPPPFPDLKR